MIAAIIFFVFFLVIYLTRPTRKRRQSKPIKLRKPELKSTLEQARQQAMDIFWVQALAQTLTNTEEKPLASETTALPEPQSTEQVQVPIIPQTEALIVAEPELGEQFQVPIIPQPETVIVAEPELPEQVQVPIIPQLEKVNDIETELPEQIRTSNLLQEESTIPTDTGLSEKIIQSLRAAAQTEPAKTTEAATSLLMPEQAVAYSAFVNYLKDFAANNVTITTQEVKHVPVQPVAPEQDIIDINPEVQPIPYEKLPNELVNYEPGIPHWDIITFIRPVKLIMPIPTSRHFISTLKNHF